MQKEIELDSTMESVIAGFGITQPTLPQIPSSTPK